MNPRTFTTLLLTWWEINKRSLPWKETHDPYKIWISEIILQQTRVDQGMPYYFKFISLFPDIYSLATASEDSVLKAWEGLGYYSRARNLHSSAKYILREKKGIFPDSYHEILSLKGIGPYTAAAIASFAYHLAYPAIDGNVIRVVSRIHGILTPVDSSISKTQIFSFVTEALPKARSGDFNQAMMDFGSMVCTPKAPKCNMCSFAEFCIARRDHVVDAIPFKSKKQAKQIRHFHYLDICLPGDKTILRQRTKGDIWKQLYELPAIETTSAEQPDLSMFKNTLDQIIPELPHSLSFEVIRVTAFRQALSHRIINGYFYKIPLYLPDIKINHEQYLVEREKVSNFAFPKIVSEYFKFVPLGSSY